VIRATEEERAKLMKDVEEKKNKVKEETERRVSGLGGATRGASATRRGLSFRT
jgi:hypothetical protein